MITVNDNNNGATAYKHTEMLDRRIRLRCAKFNNIHTHTPHNNRKCNWCGTMCVCVCVYYRVEEIFMISLHLCWDFPGEITNQLALYIWIYKYLILHFATVLITFIYKPSLDLPLTQNDKYNLIKIRRSPQSSPQKNISEVNFC